jgi:ribonuclease P protein component
LNQSFSRAQRLLTPKDFKAVFDRNESRAGNAAFLLLALTNGGDQSRLGLVVGKKVLKRAVDRNRLKRLVRESFRRHLFNRPVDIVFLARGGVSTALSEDFSEQLAAQWARLERRLLEANHQ